MTTTKDLFLESLQAIIQSLHKEGKQEAIYHLMNLLQGHSHTLDNEHLFVSGGIYWISFKPKTFWANEKINIKYEKLDN